MTIKIVEKPMAPNPDTDSPELRAAVSRLATLLSGQLAIVAGLLDEGTAGGWQLCSLCGRLDRLKTDIEYLRRDASKLSPADVDSE